MYPLMDTQLNQYLPVLMLLFVAANFAVGTLAVSVLLGKSGRRTQTKDIPYECGMLPQGEGSARLSIKFYLVALLFVLFDIEVVFMYPWAVTFKELARTDRTRPRRNAFFPGNRLRRIRLRRQKTCV